MSTPSDNERDLLAAEFALGLLEGDDSSEAERLLASDAAFAGEVADWHERLSPLLDEIAPVEPGAALWDRINSALDEGGRPGNVHQLKRRLTLWRGYSAAISAVAAALLLVIAFDAFSVRPESAPDRGTVQRPVQAAPVLVANVAAEDRSAALVVSFDPAGRSLLVAPAVITPDPEHDHQLWLIPASGTPLSLGLIASSAPHRLPVPPTLLREFRRDVTLAVSVEPVGGSRTGQPTGAVVATGKLTAI